MKHNSLLLNILNNALVSKIDTFLFCAICILIRINTYPNNIFLSKRLKEFKIVALFLQFPLLRGEYFSILPSSALASSQAKLEG
jgi:hypothetical protein